MMSELDPILLQVESEFKVKERQIEPLKRTTVVKSMSRPISQVILTNNEE